MIQGLYHELAAKISKRESAAIRLADPDISANEKHSLTWTAGDLEREIESLEKRIAEDEAVAEGLATFINTLQEFAHASRHRSLCLTHLEQAQDRLRRELGDNIPN